MTKKIAILGAAESGVGAAILARAKGMDVWVSDRSSIKAAYKAELDAHHIAWEEGQHTAARILDADEVVKSPGIPDTAPMVRQVRQAGIPIISEIELAGRYTAAKMICITGSNGKTTTTSLIYHILRHAGYDVGLAGNIGHSLARQVAESPHEWYVIELSSFQLDNMYAFRADIAVLLNITPDHLDRYGFCMQNYVDAKMRITRNLRPADAFVYWADDAVVAREIPRYGLTAHLCPFAEQAADGLAATVEGGDLVVRSRQEGGAGTAEFRTRRDSLSLPGRHNLYNMLAAATAARLAGVEAAPLAEALATFPGVEHRLERVATVRDVDYINDSKATNVDACRWALEAMTRPTILILGGLDKGNDYATILPLIRERCAGLVLLGADNAKLHSVFDHAGLPLADTHSMADCVAACADMARPGQTVLLSPCCASFDLFHNMEDRGDQFKALVRAME